MSRGDVDVEDCRAVNGGEDVMMDMGRTRAW